MRKTACTSILGLATLWAVSLGSTPLWSAPPVTPASLSPCTLTPAEVEEVFGLRLDRAEASDFTLPAGRDVGCLYTFRDSSFELTVRQTWDDNGPAVQRAAPQGGSPLANDPDGASWKAAPADRPGAGGELAYGRGKIRTRLQVRGGRLTGAEVLKKLLLLRRVP